MCWWKSATAAWPTTSSRSATISRTVLADLETRMREAAADLNFEEAARLRDEVKRLRATEMAWWMIPLPSSAWAGKAGAYPARKVRRGGKFAGGAMKNKSAATAIKASRDGRTGSKVHKPHLDEMHGRNPCLPRRRALPAKPFGGESRIIQPNDSRQSGPEFGRRRGRRAVRREARRVEEEVTNYGTSRSTT
jgi:excinuclease ABC subunit B